MSPLHIPRWVGPVVTPIVLIIFIAAFCCYYCYWKPKKLRRKADNSSQNGKTSVGKQTTKPCQVKYMDETYYSSYNTLDCPYGPFYSEVCPFPNSPVYCRPREYQPEKVFYFTKNDAEGCPVRSGRTKCLAVNNIKVKQKCKVKCQKGQCMKGPNLPIIVEGDSLVEEETCRILGNEERECENCNTLILEFEEETSEILRNGECDKCKTPCSRSANQILVECEKGSDNTKRDSETSAITVGHDSGYED